VRGFSSTDSGKKGIAIAGRPGATIIAAAAGKVVYSGEGLLRYGKLIIIKHNNTYFSAYAHNRRLLAKEGSQVKSGQKIAEMGRTGTDRTMLHFEIRKDGKSVNPLYYLPKK
jgi:lipoprotein NlpD